MAAQFQALVSQAPSYVVNFRVSLLPYDAVESRASQQDQHLSNLRPPAEFFGLPCRLLSGSKGSRLYADVHRISRPNDLNEATQRISHNVRGFRRGGLPLLTCNA
jgi:hypothetical protein